MPLSDYTSGTYCWCLCYCILEWFWFFIFSNLNSLSHISEKSTFEYFIHKLLYFWKGSDYGSDDSTASLFLLNLWKGLFLTPSTYLIPSKKNEEGNYQSSPTTRRIWIPKTFSEQETREEGYYLYVRQESIFFVKLEKILDFSFLFSVTS